MKIVVYAISKNEEKFIGRFFESAKDADSVYVFDTGSSDNTINLCRELGIVINTIHINPWRFDDARNASLAFLPSDVDVCISLDIDEILVPGWRDIIENKWTGRTTRMKYLYDWGDNVKFYADKVHSRFGYRWKYSCHEVLVPDSRFSEFITTIEDLLIKHEPDGLKHRGYLELLKVGVCEDRHDSRISFYYGRELFFNGLWNEAICELTRYLSLSMWNAEKSYAMRLIGVSHKNLGNINEYLTWCIKSVNLTPDRRESWVELALAYYLNQKWDCCFDAAVKSISIVDHRYEWPYEAKAWGYLPHDLAAISSYHLGLKEESLRFGRQALELDPLNERLQQNVYWYINQ